MSDYGPSAGASFASGFAQGFAQVYSVQKAEERREDSDLVKFNMQRFVNKKDAWNEAKKEDELIKDTAKRYAESKDSSIIWEGHRAGMERAYCHIEKMGSLGKLPNFGFLVSCFPFKIKKASAGFIRAAAILEE